MLVYASRAEAWALAAASEVTEGWLSVIKYPDGEVVAPQFVDPAVSSRRLSWT